MHPFCTTPTGSRFRVRGGSKEILRSAVKLTGMAASGTSLECAPGAGQVEVSDLTGCAGLRQRSHSIEFKRQVAQEFIAGESLYALSKRHDISRQLIRVWVRKYEAGALDEDAQAADLLQEYEAKIAALERMVGRQALEIEFLKGALRNAPRPRSVNTSVIAGPAASPSQKDAG